MGQQWANFLNGIGCRSNSHNERGALYGLRRVDATHMVVVKKAPIDTAAVNMGACAQMIERRYFHLTAYLARDMLE